MQRTKAWWAALGPKGSRDRLFVMDYERLEVGTGGYKNQCHYLELIARADNAVNAARKEAAGG